YYGRSLFHTIFEVQPTGTIEMLADKPLVSNLEASLIRVSDRENGVRLGGESVGRSISFDRLDLKRHETDPDRIATVIARSSDLPEEDASRFRRDFVLPVLGEAFVKQYSDHGRDRNAIAYDLLVADVELDLALSLAKLAVEKEPGNPYYADTLGWALLKSGLTDEAIVELERARDGDPNQAEIRAHLAQAYRISGRIEDARAEVNTALSMTVSASWKEFLQEELRLINAANE
ncbi:tetratricopeptide repeat protein, partial [Hoeflea sp.]|uniref:tetratricopeptide repeat protein n=1 Tax=Hoeflea sp. TaxID=1940281 RepID=UPI003A94775F